MEGQIADILGIENQFSREQLKEGIQTWPTTLASCKRRTDLFTDLQTKLRTDQKSIQKLEETFKTLTTHVKELEPLLRESTEVEKEGYNQVCFRGTPWSGINSIPFALVAFSIYKSYIVPAFSLFLPLLSIILPYILLKTFYNIPITFAEYTSILWKLWNGHAMPKTPEDFLNPPPEPPKDVIAQLKTYIQNGWTLFSIGQAMWQPIQQARHFIKLDANCLTLGARIVRVKEVAVGLLDSYKPWMASWMHGWTEYCPSDPRQAFAFVLDTPFWLRHLLRGLGRFEVLFRLASREDVVPAQFIRSEKPILLLKEFGDPSIPLGSRVKSSLRLGGGSYAQHGILTGPNRGGKSSFLRGILMNVVLAHSFGAAIAGQAQMTPFTWIADGMRLEDNPGKQSMFEREVAFGSAIAAREGGRGLVLYDELFHSTNPPDAKRTSELFCNALWNKSNCVSVISTHVYSLAQQAPPEKVKQFCVAAWRDVKGKFLFSYKIQQGVCEVSSVDLLLKQFGLLSRAASA